MGFPLTPKGLRKAVFQFVEENNIANPFNTETRLAGRDWINGFMKRHPDISVRKSQNLNEARARKMNHIIVDDYFKTLKSVLVEPHLIFNMDEKGLQMCRHKSPNILAKKGVRRVLNRGKEHGENVTSVAAGSAVRMAIPPMILFEGVRKDRQWTEILPTGTLVEMTRRGSMNVETFIKFLHHFAQYKPKGKCLLLLDGASCHFDVEITDTASSLDIVMLCLPSNTTHELQPFNNAIFRSMEFA